MPADPHGMSRVEETVTEPEGVGPVRGMPFVFFAPGMVQSMEGESGCGEGGDVRDDGGGEAVPVPRRGGGDIGGIDSFGERVSRADAGTDAGRYELGRRDPILGPASTMGGYKHVPNGKRSVGRINNKQ